MKLTWYGHSCFLLETNYGSVVFDPYAPGSVPGLVLPTLCADLVLCSHNHGDHAYRSAVKLTGKETNFRITAAHTFHDNANGSHRGENTIYMITAGQTRIAHLGDLGHLPAEGLLQTLHGIDLLMIPVGGYYTIGPELAVKICQAVQPGIIVPMHYRGPGFGYDVIGPVEDFAAYFQQVEYLDTNSFTPGAEYFGKVVIPKYIPV